MRARGGILLPLLPTSKREAAFEELDPRVAELGLMHLGERTQNPITVSVRKRTYLIFLSPRRSPLADSHPHRRRQSKVFFLSVEGEKSARSTVM
jgi:hypothetical protein